MNCNGFGRNRSSYHPVIIPKFCWASERREKDVPSSRWTGTGYESHTSGISTQAFTATPALRIPSCRIIDPLDAILRVERQNIWYCHAHNTMLLIRNHIWYTSSALCNSGVHLISSGEHQAMQMAGRHETGTRCSEMQGRMKWVQTETGNAMLLNCLITLLTIPRRSICEHLV